MTQPAQDERRRKPLDRDPGPPHRDTIATVGGRILDPATALQVDGVVPRPTVYVGDRLIISKAIDVDAATDVLQEIAERLGWRVELDPEDARTVGLPFGVRTASIRIASDRAAIAPDAWTLLQQTRAQYGPEAVVGVALDHVVFAADIDPDPFHIPNPFHIPGMTSEVSQPVATYAVAGSGGRQPVTYVGPDPQRHAAVKGRRPVVAVLDTGCDTNHRWFKNGVVTKGVKLGNSLIGYTDPITEPDVVGDITGQLDGLIDPLAGHGTFICGLVHQKCPDADILMWRVVPAEGPVVESDLVATLAQVVELARRGRAGEKGGRIIDVLSLSMGYYHETPQDALFDTTIFEMLNALGELGTMVVTSAGNDATSRPAFPAALWEWSNGEGPVTPPKNGLPIVSVGATNPSGRTDALFTNTGPWVRCYEPGASLLSAMPLFNGGLRPMAATTAFGRKRASIDPDDFSGGFGLWSGTSFSGPVLAGKLAEALCGQLSESETARKAVNRARRVLERLAPIAPH